MNSKQIAYTAVISLVVVLAYERYAHAGAAVKGRGPRVAP